MKLLVSDFDLTLFDDNYDDNIRLVNDFVNKGNLFVIATGRPYKMLEKDIKNKQINYSYLICTDGCVVYDTNLNVLTMHCLNADVANSIVEIFKSNSNINRIFIDEVNGKICGVYGLYNDLNEAESLLNELMKTYDIGGYVGMHWINIISKNISKTDGIEYIQNQLDIDDSLVYTIGDADNDLTMIKRYNGYKIDDEIFDGNRVKSFMEFIEILSESNIN